MLKSKRNSLPNHDKAWTSEDDATVLQRRKQGVSLKKIAAELGRTTNAVSYRLSVLNKTAKVIQVIKPEHVSEEPVKTPNPVVEAFVPLPTSAVNIVLGNKTITVTQDAVTISL